MGTSGRFSAALAAEMNLAPPLFFPEQTHRVPAIANGRSRAAPGTRRRDVVLDRRSPQSLSLYPRSVSPRRSPRIAVTGVEPVHVELGHSSRDCLTVPVLRAATIASRSRPERGKPRTRLHHRDRGRPLLLYRGRAPCGLPGRRYQGPRVLPQRPPELEQEGGSVPHPRHLHGSERGRVHGLPARPRRARHFSRDRSQGQLLRVRPR